jgi:hypothetical protein
VCLLGLLDTEDKENTLFETSVILYQLCTNYVPIGMFRRPKQLYTWKDEAQKALFKDPVHTAL